MTETGEMVCTACGAAAGEGSGPDPGGVVKESRTGRECARTFARRSA